MQIETKAIVVKTIKYAEADTILTLVSQKLGKITVFAKSSKRVKSPLMSASQMFAYSDFSLSYQSGSYKLLRAELIKNYYSLSSNIEKYFYASYFMELAEKIMIEHHTNIKLFNLLNETLDLLLVIPEDKLRLIKLIYELKVIEYSGFKPEVLKCSNCGMNELERPRYFSIIEGGTICSKCKDIVKPVMTLEPASIRFIQYVYSNDIAFVTKAKVAQIIIDQLNMVIYHYIKEYLGTLNLKSINFIDNY